MLSRERMQNLFLEMIQIYSPSKGEKEMADFIEAYLTKRGISFRSNNADRSGKDTAATEEILSPIFRGQKRGFRWDLPPTWTRLSHAGT